MRTERHSPAPPTHTPSIPSVPVVPPSPPILCESPPPLTSPVPECAIYDCYSLRAPSASLRPSQEIQQPPLPSPLHRT